MITLLVDMPVFLNITIEDCINYNSYQKLEVIVKNCVTVAMKQIIKNTDIKEKEDKSKHILQLVLLKLSTNKTWINFSKEYNLDQLYIYRLIYKYIYLENPLFFS